MPGYQRILFVVLYWLSCLTAYAQLSVLGQGNWYKIGVTQSGIHRIDEGFLRKLGLNPATINPNFIRLYGNGGGMLPQANQAPRVGDLVENAIFVKGQADNQFDNSDYVLFYAQSPHELLFDMDSKTISHQYNLYSDTTFYFLTIGDTPGLRVPDQPSVSAAAQITAFDDYAYIEKDLKNILQSGREWYGDLFGFTTEYTYDFALSGIVPNSKVYLTSSVMARSTGFSKFALKVNGQVAGTQEISPISGGKYDYWGNNDVNTFVLDASLTGSGSALKATVTYDKAGNVNAQGYLNFLAFQAKRELKAAMTQLAFRSFESLTYPEATFVLKEARSDLQIWDVTQPLQPSNQVYTLSGTEAAFGIQTSSLKEFIAFTDKQAYTPVSGRLMANQSLRTMATPNLLIVTHESLLAQARKLAAFRTSHDGLVVEVVTTAQVFNEFSSGMQDVTAIRDFVRYLYGKAPSTLKYLLLFGNATYDYKSQTNSAAAFVPVYEARESLHPIYSYSSDDYFGFLEDQEGEWIEEGSGDHTLEIGVGRLPVRTPKEADNMVNKLIRYATDTKALGKWRNKVTFVADDGDANTHQQDADRLAQMIGANYPLYNVNKIYTDAFPQLVAPDGQTAPQVQSAINQAIDRGTLIINYTGHGGETGWAAEKLLGLQDIASWKNPDRLPLFVTATCEFGRYDDPGRTSGAELILMDKDAGGIGLVTTTRPVFSNTNYLLNDAFYNAVFKPLSPGIMPRLGDVVRQTKNNSLSGSVNRNFSLLGDPSMRLAYPKEEVVLTKLNGNSLDATAPDTLSALSPVSLEGEIRLVGNASVAEDFTGLLYLSVFDKESIVTTFGTEQSARMNFALRKNLLFEGQASVRNGRFKVSFVVPKDIEYPFGPGKISVYAQSSNAGRDAGGVMSLIVGGSSKNILVDNKPPAIELFMNDSLFVNGGPVQSNATLLVKLSDENGINIAGGGIGHDITATLDQSDSLIILNTFYTADRDTYQKGRVLYPFHHLAKGQHTLKVKAWDTYTNSSEASLTFTVVEGEPLTIFNVSNYPNPFTASQSTAFQFSHNRLEEDLEVIVEIFDVWGRLLKRLSAEWEADSENEPMNWDGRDEEGAFISEGLYIYQVTLRSLQGGLQDRKAGKLFFYR